MYLTDLHCHTKYSFDSEADPEEVILTAISKNIKTIALTDHADVDCQDCGLYIDFDFPGRKEELEALKKKYKDKINVLYGIEIGQPYSRKEFSSRFVSENDFDFVIGSVHNLNMVPDFCFMKYSSMSDSIIENLFKRYIENNIKLAEVPYVDTIAHLTYPMRYIYLSGKTLNVQKFYDDYQRLFSLIIKNGKAIELNVSTLRRGLDFTMPGEDILAIYKSLGGKYITVGSDAHFTKDVGANIEDGYALAEKLGLTVIDTFK